METLLFTTLVTLFIGGHLLELYALKKNDLARYKEIPKNSQDIYDESRFSKWLAYEGEHARVSMIEQVISLVVITFLFLYGGFAWLAQTLAFDSLYIETLLFFGVIGAVLLIVDTAISIYTNFSIEARYDFNTMTKKQFIKDTIIKTLMGGALMALLLYVVTLFYSVAGIYFVPLLALVLIVFQLLMQMIYVPLILPLFNKATPLEDGELKTRIEALAIAHDYKVKKISIMDASRRSKKLNAFFIGFGRFKEIMLFDTLTESMDDDQILAVLAHEIAHAKHKDTLKMVGLSVVSSLVILSLLYAFLTVDIFTAAFNLSSFHLGFMVFAFFVFMKPLNIVLSIFTNQMMRRMEYKADAFAKAAVSENAMVTALKVIARENFAHLTPDDLSITLYYTHPPIPARIHALEGDDDAS